MARQRYLLWHLLVGWSLFIFLRSNVYSGSVDVAHHFLFINYISQNGWSNLAYDPSVAGMSIYPPGAHWLAVALTSLAGNSYLAMWLVAIVGVYLVYFFLLRLAFDAKGASSILLAFVLFLFGSRTLATPGYEVSSNFFYAQLVATVTYFAFLATFESTQRTREWLRAFVVLVVCYVNLWIHALPTLALIGTYLTYLFLSWVFSIVEEKKALLGQLLVIFAISAIALIEIITHPAFADMRMLSDNDGSLDFAVPYPIIIAIAVAILLTLIVKLSVTPRSRQNSVLLLLASGLMACLLLLLVQFLALSLLHSGSPYAIKKYAFLISGLTVVSIASFLPVVRPKILQHERIRLIFASVGSAVLTVTVFTSSIVLPMRDVLSPLSFAESAIGTGFPDFRPGNTAVVASSVNYVVRYMISETVFKMPFPEAVKMLGSDFSPSKSKYVMADNDDSLRSRCPEPAAQNRLYAIVSLDCFSSFPLGQPVRFGTGLPGIQNLKAGWWQPEAWGVWGRGSTSTLEFSLPPQVRGQAATISFDLSGTPTTESDPVRGTIEAGGVSGPFSIRLTGQVSLTLPPQATLSGVLNVTFSVENPISPKQLKLSPDDRLLGVGLISMVVSK